MQANFYCDWQPGGAVVSFMILWLQLGITETWIEKQI